MEGDENKQGEEQEVSEESQQEQAPQAETFPGKVDKQAVLDCAQDVKTGNYYIKIGPSADPVVGFRGGAGKRDPQDVQLQINECLKYLVS